MPYLITPKQALHLTARWLSGPPPMGADEGNRPTPDHRDVLLAMIQATARGGSPGAAALAGPDARPVTRAKG